MNNKFYNWVLKKKDIDGLIIAMLLSNSINSLIINFTDGILQPLISSLFNINIKKQQQIYILGHYIEMNINIVLRSCIIFLFSIYISYIISKYNN